MCWGMPADFIQPVLYYCNYYDHHHQGHLMANCQTARVTDNQTVMLSNDHRDISLDGGAGTEHQVQHPPYQFTTLQEMAADAAAEETLRLFEQDFQDDTRLVYLAALWQLHDLVEPEPEKKN